MNLQSVSLVKASAPISDISTSAPGHSNAAKPAPPVFNHVLGSLIAGEGKPPVPVSSRKQVSPQDPLAGQLPETGTPPAQPVILPLVLKFNLLFPASSKTSASESDESDGSYDAGGGANPVAQAGANLAQLAVLQVVPQPAPPVADPGPQTLLLQAQGPPRGSAYGGDLLHDQRNQNSLLEPLNLSTSDSEKAEYAVSTDEGQPLSRAELALSVKITPTAAPVSVSANTPSVTPAPRLSTAPIASPETASGPAAGANQQADTNADSDPGQTPKQILKPQTKTQSEPALPNTDLAPVAGNQYSAPVMTPVAPAGPVPDAAPVTKHESQPATQPVDARPAVAALIEAGATSKPEPVKDLSIRIGNTPGNQVDVKIQERAGEIHVSVLSSSAALTSDLRQQVGDLVGKLDRAGYHAETFKPAASQQSSNQSDSQERDPSGGRQQQQQQETAQQQFLGRQKRSNQAQWLQQMNGSFGLTATEGIERQ